MNPHSLSLWISLSSKWKIILYMFCLYRNVKKKKKYGLDHDSVLENVCNRRFPSKSRRLIAGKSLNFTRVNSPNLDRFENRHALTFQRKEKRTTRREFEASNDNKCEKRAYVCTYHVAAWLFLAATHVKDITYDTAYPWSAPSYSRSVGFISVERSPPSGNP